jgi:hypothetical protein
MPINWEDREYSSWKSRDGPFEARDVDEHHSRQVAFGLQNSEVLPTSCHNVDLAKVRFRAELDKGTSSAIHHSELRRWVCSNDSQRHSSVYISDSREFIHVHSAAGHVPPVHVVPADVAEASFRLEHLHLQPHNRHAASTCMQNPMLDESRDIVILICSDDCVGRRLRDRAIRG